MGRKAKRSVYPRKEQLERMCKGSGEEKSCCFCWPSMKSGLFSKLVVILYRFNSFLKQTIERIKVFMFIKRRLDVENT